jgi:hypothetical protein
VIGMSVRDYSEGSGFVEGVAGDVLSELNGAAVGY